MAEELNDIFGRTWELVDRKQTLELLRLMVKVESTKERIVLMKILQVTKDCDVLNNFIRYKGLTLLWSWMVDAPDSKAKYKIEVFFIFVHKFSKFISIIFFCSFWLINKDWYDNYRIIYFFLRDLMISILGMFWYFL